METQGESKDSRVQAIAGRLHPAWVGVLGALLYLPTTRYGLIRYDDPWLIRDNALLHHFTWDGIRRVFFDLSLEQRLQLGAEYLPVRDLSVMLDFAIWGDRFAGHHVTQVLLYAGLCALAATLVLRLFEKRALAWWVGVAFALHPVHVEAVAWLSERKGVLGGLLFFGAACLGVRYLRVGRVAWLAGCLLLFAASVLAKGHMLGGAAALAMCALWCADAPSQRRWALGASAVVLGALVFVPIYVAGQSVGMVQPYHGGGFLQTLALSCTVHGKYLLLMMLGGPYSIAYPVGADFANVGLLGLGLLGLLVFAFFTVRAVFQSSRRSAANFGLGWWLIFLAPVSHVVFPLQNLLADRYLLIGSWGLLLVFGVGVVRLPSRGAWVVGLSWLVASTTWSVTQLGHWESSRALRLHAVSVHPSHVESWHRLASQAEEEGKYEQAEAYVARGLEQAGSATDRWRLYHRRALILEKQGRVDEAIRWMRAAASQPAAHKAYANLGLLLARRGEIQDGLEQVRRACEYQPRSVHNQRAHGIVALEAGEVDEACAAFAEARALEPFNADNHFNLGLCELRRGDQRASDKAFEQALELRPNLAEQIDQARRSVLR
ncbi:MAG: tetratricopeptide repeat protein [Myxococcales bacterium]|nr:tetratricopeptide repeat protein [Myxococcales bacterium]MDH3483189.1 tetratricopeptide repeat protein [Myxococcales bacterium]